MNVPTPSAPIVLGIDPGVCTGLAGYDPEAHRLDFVASAAPLDALRLFALWHRAGLILAAWVEDSRDLPLYARHRGLSRGARDRAARSVGQVDALTELYVCALRGYGVPVATVAPAVIRKWDGATFRRVTGHDGRTNQHGRDAARLAWGRPAPPRPRDVSTEGGGMPCPTSP